MLTLRRAICGAPPAWPLHILAPGAGEVFRRPVFESYPRQKSAENSRGPTGFSVLLHLIIIIKCDVDPESGSINHLCLIECGVGRLVVQ